jgi:Zn-dependent M28 family amino/carboxypeptidase
VIHNGADDDASGCAALLELAGALAAGPRPARTLVFLFATGEEAGLHGTDWYIEHPLVPLASTVCNLNLEMIGRPDPLAGGAGGLWLTGDERTSLGDAFRALGMAVVADPRPGERFFERSDNYAFARRGIVAQTLSSFNLHADYHGVDDELERLDLAHMEGATRAALVGARALADGTLEPTWKPGGDPSGD